MIVRLDLRADNDATSLRDFAETFSRRPHGNREHLNGVEIRTEIHHNERSYDAGMPEARYVVYHRERCDSTGLRPFGCGYGLTGLEKAISHVQTYGGWVVETRYMPVPYKGEIEKLLKDSVTNPQDWYGFPGGSVKREDSNGTPWGSYRVMNTIDPNTPEHGQTVFCQTFAAAVWAVSKVMVAFFASDRHRKEKAKRAKEDAFLHRPGRNPHKPIGWDASTDELCQLLNIPALHQ